MRVCRYASLLSLSFLGILSAAPAQADGRLSLGVEGFHDHYQEQNATVNIASWNGSVTGSYEYDNGGYFAAIDGRYSKGTEDYSSISGTFNGEHAFETDDRLRVGLDIPTGMWHGHMMPYIGGGWRYYFDEGKGLKSSTGAVFYDRHISQFYIPVGSTFRFAFGDWTFAPTVEADALVYGQVNNHFAPVGVDQNVTNQQHTGWGLRGELMVGQQFKYFGWEAGPFVRYWHISDSSCKETVNSAPDCWYEPSNTRLQAGAALRFNF